MKDRIIRTNAQPDYYYLFPEIWRTVWCCREWEINPTQPIGRCGLCGKRPV